MFANHANKTKTPAEAKAKQTNGAPSRTDASLVNPVWQSLALRPIGIQTKLAIGRADDPSEREADQVADRVMRMATSPSGDTGLSFSPQPALKVQRKCDHCEDEEEKALQRKERGDNTASEAAAPSIAHEEVNSRGQPLDAVTRSFMEARFDHDFGPVRVHTNGRAATAAQGVHAPAYTSGRDIVFGSGEYAPATVEGKRLLAMNSRM